MSRQKLGILVLVYKISLWHEKYLGLPVYVYEYPMETQDWSNADYHRLCPFCKYLAPTSSCLSPTKSLNRLVDSLLLKTVFVPTAVMLWCTCGYLRFCPRLLLLWHELVLYTALFVKQQKMWFDVHIHAIKLLPFAYPDHAQVHCSVWDLGWIVWLVCNPAVGDEQEEERGVHQVHLEGRHSSQEAAGSYRTHGRVSVAEWFNMWSVVRLAGSLITCRHTGGSLLCISIPFECVLEK